MTMNERSKLLKKAVMAGVGASTSVDRIRTALEEAMHDLVKVGQGLFKDLEETGKVKTESMQDLLKNLQTEATKRTAKMEKTVSSRVQIELKKAAREIGLVMQEDWEEMCDRLGEIEKSMGIAPKRKAGNGNNPQQGHRSKRKKPHRQG